MLCKLQCEPLPSSQIMKAATISAVEGLLQQKMLPAIGAGCLQSDSPALLSGAAASGGCKVGVDKNVVLG